MVAVVADAQGLPFVPPDQRPIFGTFWEVHSSLPCLGAPLPTPPLDTNTPVYAIGDPVVVGQFLMDETAGQVISPQAQSVQRALRSMSTASILQAQTEELQAFVAQVQAAQVSAQLRANDQMSRLRPDGGATFGPMPNTSYTADDLWLEVVTVTDATGFFVVHPPEAEATNGVYDLLMTTLLSADAPGLNLTNWYWLLRTSPGETNLVVPDLPAAQAYFRLARTNDADGDGLSDAIELLVTHTDPNTPSPNPFPVIVSQPLSQTVFEGDSVTFTAQANGALPLSYQWRFTAPGLATTNITGATDPSLTLNNISSTAAGSYSVLVFNALGSAVSSNAVLTVTNSGEFATVLVGPRQDYRFKGDKTYYVDGSAGPVDLYGTTTIEGGAVVKYATNTGATLVIRGSLVCQTTPWHPAIFTAVDDDMLGWRILSSSGTPTNFYAPVALDINSSENIALKHVRITYAQTAIHYSGDSSRDVLGTLRHAQVLHCAAGLVSDGSTNHPCQIDVANVLFSDVGQAITGTRFRGSANHLTVDHCNTFVSDTNSTALGFFVTNSVFGDTTSLGDGAGLDGSNNGFYTDHAPQFGTGGVTDDQSPFAPTGGVDGQGNPFLYIVNGQGAYYLRDGSPFAGAGATNVASSLKSDFAQMTTAVPPDLLSDDINSSTTIGPTAIRDPNATALGYHYPVVDHVLMLATVNNATLNVEPGTVLALVGYPYWWANWGIRLNPGGRLNVNGLPTNHVTFAHLEAVQESTIGELGPFGPMLNWRDLGFFSGLATPYPEVRVHYADFPTISAGYNAHLCSLDYDPESYSIISNLELDGCLLQGGWFVYDDGGPPGRTLTVRNTVFDRCEVWMLDMGAYEHYFQATAQSAQVAAANNLFHQCFMALYPVEGSSSWTFTDNIFDHVPFYSIYDQWFLNGPIGTNHHNAYVGMSGVPNGGGRLIPAAPTTTDPNLPTLSYERGPLGKFYLPATATNLLAKGSRLAGAAGEYHFTSRTNSPKEATAQVSIGPHYLALVSGGAPDSNTDGVPDFIADRNGNGVEEANEAPWLSANTSPLSIVSPTAGSTVSGVIQLYLNLGSWVPLGITHVAPMVDGQDLPGMTALNLPAQSVAAIQVDTTYLTNGPHSFSVRAHLGSRPDTMPGGYTVESPPVLLTSANDTTQPMWQGRAQRAVKVDLQTAATPTNYVLWFFNAGYPKAPDPFNPAIQTYSCQGTLSNGVLSWTGNPTNVVGGNGNASPAIYSFTEFSTQSLGDDPNPADRTTANPNILNDPEFPPIGLWAAAYDDTAVDYAPNSDPNAPPGPPGLEAFTVVADLKDASNCYWVHDNQLGGSSLPQYPPDSHGPGVGWAAAGTFAHPTEGGTILYAPPNGSRPQTSSAPQTWPIRGAEWKVNRQGFDNDILLLGNILASPSVRNFYGLAHNITVHHLGDLQTFMYLTGGPFPQRYRFVFLDGCQSYQYNFFAMFGAVCAEVPPQDYRDASNNRITGCHSEEDELTFYANSGLRPAAFMGWITDVRYITGRASADIPWTTTTGLPGQTDFWLDEALGNWHEQFLAYWMLGIDSTRKGLLEAKQQADWLAWILPQSSPWPGVLPPPPPAADLQVGEDSQGPIYSSPVTSLKIGGYQELQFNQWNHADDDLPQSAP